MKIINETARRLKVERAARALQEGGTWRDAEASSGLCISTLKLWSKRLGVKYPLPKRSSKRISESKQQAIVVSMAERLASGDNITAAAMATAKALSCARSTAVRYWELHLAATRENARRDALVSQFMQQQVVSQSPCVIAQ